MTNNKLPMIILGLAVIAAAAYFGLGMNKPADTTTAEAMNPAIEQAADQAKAAVDAAAEAANKLAPAAGEPAKQ